MIRKTENIQLKRLGSMGKVKEIMNYYDDYTDVEIHLKMSVEHQYYVSLYEKDIQEELNCLGYEDKN
jgi:hypothetical protein